MEAGDTLLMAVHSPGSNPNPLRMWISLGGNVIVIRPNFDPAKFQDSVVSNYSCCGFRIEVAVGSLPYPRHSGVPNAW